MTHNAHVNVRLDRWSNAQLPLMVHSKAVQYDSKRRYTKAQEVDALAGENYMKNGRGITFRDLISAGLAKHKSQAQNTLKRCLSKKILFVIEERKPQQYFPSSLKAEILKAKYSKNVPIGVTQVPYLQSIPVSSKDAIVRQTLEGYVLPILRDTPLEIHKIQLELKLNPEYYNEICLLARSENKRKAHEEIIASVLVRYLFYPNGTVMIFVARSNTPFKLERNEDLGRLIAFLGAVRDRLVVFLHDRHERAVPDIMQWHLTECDINRELSVSGWLQFTGLNIQVRHAFHLFRLYIKSKGENTLCRVEELITPKNKPVLKAINDVFNPTERLEKQIEDLNLKIDRLLSSPCNDMIGSTNKTSCNCFPKDRRCSAN
jgi:hypothetical protein